MMIFSLPKLRLTSLPLLLLSLSLTACMQPEVKPTENAAEALQRDVDARTDTQTFAQLAEDIDDKTLQTTLQQSQAETKLNEEKLAAAQKAQDTEKVQALQARLKTLDQHIQQSIKQHYEEFKVDFLNVDYWKLRPEGRQYLKANKSALCRNPNQRIIIYGYGGYIGGEKATQNVSNLRAKSIEAWIKGNTRCKKMLVRGLGIHINAREIQNANISAEEKQRILEASRHARIFVRKGS